MMMNDTTPSSLLLFPTTLTSPTLLNSHLPDLNHHLNQTSPSESSPEDCNVSRVSDVVAIIQHHAHYSIVINKCVTPLWYVVGLTGNVISALFWSSQRMRTCNTAAVYLTTLALADFSYLALHVFYELQNPWLVRTLNVAWWCQIWNSLYMAAQYFCVFIVCAFTCERFLSVCHPFKSERFGRKRSPQIILVLLLVSLLLASPQAYFWTVRSSCECHVRVSQLRKTSFYSLWSWCTDMLIFGALPVIVLVLNVCVLRKIRRAGKLRLSDSPSRESFSGWTLYSRLSSKRDNRASVKREPRVNPGGAKGPGDPSEEMTSVRGSVTAGGGALNAPSSSSCTSGGSHNFTATTVTLLWVSFFLIFTTLPVTFVFAIQTVIPLGDPMPLEQMGTDPAWRRFIAYYVTRVIIREVGMSHHVGNVFIYLATSRRFRQQLRKRVWRGGSTPCSPSGDVLSTSLHTPHQLKPIKKDGSR